MPSCGLTAVCDALSSVTLPPDEALTGSSYQELIFTEISWNLK